MYTKQLVRIYGIGAVGVFGNFAYSYATAEYPPEPVLLYSTFAVLTSLAWPIFTPLYIVGMGLEYSNKLYNENKYNKKKKN
jgi:hypothetical protein